MDATTVTPGRTAAPGPAYRTLPWSVVLWGSLCMATGLGISEALLDYVDQRYGSEAVERLHHWQALTYPSSEGGDIDKLERVNRFFNRMQFIDDQQHWGRRDYWATPVEMIVSNGGDCEDFSIAKYFTLLEMGIPERRLRITYVKATTLNQGHMVLASTRTRVRFRSSWTTW